MISKQIIEFFKTLPEEKEKKYPICRLHMYRRKATDQHKDMIYNFEFKMDVIYWLQQLFEGSKTISTHDKQWKLAKIEHVSSKKTLVIGNPYLK